MTAKKRMSNRTPEREAEVTHEEISFASRRRDRGEIVDAAVRGLRCDLEEIRKLTLNA